MNNIKSKINDKIINLVFYLTLLIPLLIFTKFLLGYKVIVFIDAILTLLLFILITPLKTKKIDSYSIYKLSVILFMIILLVGLLLPSIEYLGIKTTFYADMLFIIPALIYLSFYIYYYKKGYIDISD